MKKTVLSVLVCGIMATGCQKSAIEATSANEPVLSEASSGRRCASFDVLQRQLQEDPTLARNMNLIEDFTARYAQNPSQFRLVNGVIEIPVVVCPPLKVL